MSDKYLKGTQVKLNDDTFRGFMLGMFCGVLICIFGIGLAMFMRWLIYHG